MDSGSLPLPTPFTPPTTEEDILIWIRLIRSRKVGPATFWRLIGEEGSARAALAALPILARQAHIEGYTPCSEAMARAELAAGKRAGARLLLRGGPDYPAALAEMSDAPPLLWALGDLTQLQRPMVALVGARVASSLGLRMARQIARGLAEAGVSVVSGLARGIDAAAHDAALPGATIAVQAGGIEVIYPPENTGLAQAIAANGLRLSEQPPGLQPQARHFPQRNRIIAGLAQAVVVVEAALQSGSLITAREALDRGREVFAVPGHPMDGRAAGCNALIRDGALLVRSADDVLEALSLPARPAPDSASNPDTGDARRDQALARPDPGLATPGLTPTSKAPIPGPGRQRGPGLIRALHEQILNRLSPSPLHEDQLIRDLGAPAAQVAPALVLLEIDGQIERHRGGFVSRLPC